MKKFLLALLAAVMCIGFAACTPSSVEKAKTKMNEAGYTCVDYSNDDEDAEGMIGGFIASKGLLSDDKLTAMLFSSKEEAAEFYANVDDLGFVLDGKWVYSGSEAAIEVFTALF